jgi:hypothetical protein
LTWNSPPIGAPAASKRCPWMLLPLVSVPPPPPTLCHTTTKPPVTGATHGKLWKPVVYVFTWKSLPMGCQSASKRRAWTLPFVRVRPRAAVAPPDHHESLRAVRDDGGKKLIPGRVGIHLELAPGRRARRIEATRPDAGAAGILRGGIRLPDHDEAVRAVRRDRRIALPSGREAVHQEFRTDGIARRGLCERPPPECGEEARPRPSACGS